MFGYEEYEHEYKIITTHLKLPLTVSVVSIVLPSVHLLKLQLLLYTPLSLRIKVTVEGPKPVRKTKCATLLSRSCYDKKQSAINKKIHLLSDTPLSAV